MEPRDALRRLGVLGAAFILVVAGGIAFSGGTAADPPAVESLTVDAYTGNDTVASVPAETGRIELTANASGKVVLIDASHGASMDREQLTPLVTALTRNGAEVRFLSEEVRRRGPMESPFNASLRAADAFIAFGAARQYTPAQVNGLEAFADAGGRVLLLREPAQMELGFLFFRPDRRESVPRPLTPLVSRFGVAFGNGYLYNMHQYDTNYRNVYATPTGDSQLTDGVDRLVLHEAIPVRGPRTVLRTTERTELSETRKSDRYGVVVRAGNLVAVGDASVLGQAYYRRADNEVFVGNLLEFLVTGEKTPPNAPQPPQDEGPERPPRDEPP